MVHVYRLDSVTKSATFYTEMSDLPDRLATFVEPVLLTSDVNVRLERSTQWRQRPAWAIDLLQNQSVYWYTGCVRSRSLFDVCYSQPWWSVRCRRTCALTCYRCKWSWSTLICRITVCFGGWCRYLDRVLSICWKLVSQSWSRLDRNSLHAVLRLSLLGCPESGLHWTLMDSLGCTTMISPTLWMISLRTVRFKRHPSDWYICYCILIAYLVIVIPLLWFTCDVGRVNNRILLYCIVLDPWFDDNCRAAKRPSAWTCFSSCCRRGSYFCMDSTASWVKAPASAETGSFQERKDRRWTFDFSVTLAVHWHVDVPQSLTDDMLKLKVNYEIYIADRKATTCI